MGVYWLDPPVRLDIPSRNVWVDIDLSPYVSNGEGMAIFRVYCKSSSGGNFICRQNGSTDDRSVLSMNAGEHIGAFCGYDANGVFEIKVGHLVNTEVYLVGYLDSMSATPITNSIVKPLNTINSFIDIETNQQNIKGIFFEASSSVTQNLVNIRNNGSTDYSTTSTLSPRLWGFVGTDENGIFEARASKLGVEFFISGYIKADVELYTNQIHQTISSFNTYEDLSPLPSGANGGFFKILTTTKNNGSWSLKKNGTDSLDLYKDIRNNYSYSFCAVEADESGIIEAKIEASNVNIFLMGHSMAEQSGLGMFTKVSNTIKNVDKGYIKVGGIWKPIIKVPKKIGGVWKE